VPVPGLAIIYKLGKIIIKLLLAVENSLNLYSIYIELAVKYQIVEGQEIDSVKFFSRKIFVLSIFSTNFYQKNNQVHFYSINFGWI
jgi:hypothetical protein